MHASNTTSLTRALLGCLAVVISNWKPGPAQPLIFGLSREFDSNWKVERLDLASGRAEQLLSGEWLYSLDFDKVANHLYVGGPHILRYDLNTATIDTVLTNKRFRDLHGWRGGTPCDHHGISLDTLNQQIYATGECWGGPHLIRINLDGTGLEWIDGVSGMDVEIDYEYERSWAYIRNEGQLTRFRVDVWHAERLLESRVFDLAIDHGDRKIYWTDEKTIMRVNFDGTDVEQIVEASDVGSIYGIVLDLSRRHLYFSADGLFRVNLDGSDLVQVSEHLYDKLAIDEGSASTPIAPDMIPSSGLDLAQNYPNPFARTTTITYTLTRSANVRLTINDLLGRTIRVLADGTKASGRHDVRFETGDLPSGTYLCRLEAHDSVQSRTFVIAR